AEHDAVALVQVVVHPFDLVGVHIGRGGLNGSRQVVNDLGFGGGLPDFGDGVAYLQGELGLGGAEDFRRILVQPSGFRVLGGVFLDQTGARQGDFLDLVLAHVED